ncbi:hypothetical protein N0V94_007909 [Neodidymelliopsis sp. IMI 364377]|nr:hypothetical protein N0V94_007909 [Neodidymelliopsis sp. IMI 364377]
MHTSISPQPVSSLGTLLSACMAKKVEKELQNIYGQTLSHANYLRNTADVEFFEALEEHRIDLVMVKEDAVAELEKMVTDTLEAFREQCEDVGEASLERVAEKADDICDNVTQRLHEREQGGKGRSKCEREELRRDRGWLGWEKEVLERDKRRFEHERRQKNECSDSETRDRRAGSAPL